MSDNDSNSEEDIRPNPTTMEGMIWDANHVIEKALASDINGMLRRLVAECVGVVMMHSVQMGLIFYGTTATGILLRKNSNDSGWSPPCAVGMSDLGYGIWAGVLTSDLIVFIMDPITLDGMLTEHGAKIGSKFDATIGSFGRTGLTDFKHSKDACGPTFTLAYTSGACVGIGLQGATIGPLETANNTFYSATVSPKDIVEGNVAVLACKTTMLQEVYDKLDKLVEGTSTEPMSEEEEKKVSARNVTMAGHDSIQSSDEVVDVDAGQGIILII